MLQIYFGFALFVASSLTAAAQQSALDCAVAAAMNYNKALLALHEQTGIKSVEAEIAERRLEEQYCLERTKCEMQTVDASVPWFKMAFASMFGECLRDEAEEKLRHDPAGPKRKK